MSLNITKVCQKKKDQIQTKGNIHFKAKKKKDKYFWYLEMKSVLISLTCRLTI